MSSLHTYKLTHLFSPKITRKITADYIHESLILLGIFSVAANKKCINIVQSKNFIKYLEKGGVLRRTHRLFSYSIDFL